MTDPKPYLDPIVFGNIDESSIAKAATRTKGAAGPSRLDTDGWRRILISKNYGRTEKIYEQLWQERHIFCVHKKSLRKVSLETYVANRLVPLEKSPSGVRPI